MAGTPPDSGLSSECLDEEALRSLLKGIEQQAFETHIGSCQRCRERLQSLAGGELDIESRPLSNANPSEALQRVMTSLKTPATPIEDWLEPSTDENLLGLLGPYEVRKILAEGGMGLVLEARDPLLNRDVAIKLIKPEQVGSNLARERMLREARAVAAIEHESVVPIYAAEVSEKTGALFIVMPLVTGGNLQDRLDEKSAPFSDAEIISIANQIASALAAVHAQGILHRDIKPANILMRDDHKIWLADFGIAHNDDDQGLTGAGEIAGTPQFMSPEQVNSEKCDARSDLFSFGAVLYQLATGRPAFAGDTAIKTARAIADRPHRPASSLNPDLSSPLSELIDGLLEKAPEKRPQSAVEVTTLLTSPGARKKSSRLPQLLIAAIVISLTAWFVFRPPSSEPAPSTSWASESFTNARLAQGYSSLSEAIASASAGDSIEIRIAGQFDCEALPTITKALLIRAAEGFQPVLISNNSGKPFLHHTAPLVLEGLSFKQQSSTRAPLPVIRSEASLSATHCSFSRDALPLRPGVRPHSGIVTATNSKRIEIINSAIISVGSNAITLTSGTKELRLKNVLIATPVGIFFRHHDLEKITVQIEQSSFHGKGLAAWDRSGDKQISPVDFKLTRSAIETTMGVFGIHTSDLEAVKSAIKFEGAENIYAPDTPFLLFAPPATKNQITTLEDWQEFWPLGDKASQLCEMDLTKRMRAYRQRGKTGKSDLRPSSKATELFPEHGFDREVAGRRENLRQFQQSEAYQAWLKRATEGWSDFSPKK
ncbi:serine/threonine protein kinase [Akkermansiaceae bacterium]|nr:serine/threonine protein kinase [Akkermansiaceae bacterium]